MSKFLKFLFILIVLTLTAMVPLFFSKADVMPFWAAKLSYILGMSWLIIFMYIVFAEIVMVAILMLSFFFTSKEQRKGLRTKLYIFFAALITLLLVYGNINYHHKERVALRIDTPKDFGREHLRVVALADLHLGYGIGRDELAKWVETINAEEPDLVIIAGDIVDAGVRPLEREGLAELFRQIKAPLGVYSIPGNHELYYPVGIESFMEKAGIKYLVDETAPVADSLYIIGRDDYTNKSRMSASMLATLDENRLPVDPNKLRIMLDHQPFALQDARYADIQLSGHTHNGQVWPVNYITDKMYDISHGHEKRADTDIIVSSGIGVWGGKFRVFTKSEYWVLDIHSTRKL